MRRDVILTWGEEIDWVNEVEEIEDRFKKLAREIESEMFLYSSAFLYSCFSIFLMTIFLMIIKCSNVLAINLFDSRRIILRGIFFPVYSVYF